MAAITESASKVETNSFIWLHLSSLNCKSVGKDRYYRVKWKAFSEKEATWEPEENIPAPIIENYHTDYTLTGKKIKRKNKT